MTYALGKIIVERMKVEKLDMVVIPTIRLNVRSLPTKNAQLLGHIEPGLNILTRGKVKGEIGIRSTTKIATPIYTPSSPGLRFLSP